MAGLDLKTTGDDLSALWEHVSDLRSNAMVVKVEPELLKRFLLDHRKLLKFYDERKDT